MTALEGWTLSVEDGELRQDLAGHGYVLDAVSTMELPKHFPRLPTQHFVYFYNDIEKKITPRYVAVLYYKAVAGKI